MVRAPAMRPGKRGPRSARRPSHDACGAGSGYAAVYLNEAAAVWQDMKRQRSGRAVAAGRRSGLFFPAQCADQIFQKAGHLAAHQSEVRIELFGFVMRGHAAFL